MPRNTALVVSREKGDFVNVIQTPLAAQGAHGRQAEVQLCDPGLSQLVCSNRNVAAGLLGSVLVQLQ